jgi:hypothetical protein
MPLHLIKIAVGAETIDDMRRWQKERLAKHGRLFHITRHKPKLEDDILDGGSIYWIIKSFVRVRQRIVGFEETTWPKRGKCCLLLLDKKLVPTEMQPRRAHQGWRYYKANEAPRDLPKGMKPHKDPPAKMAAELRALGLL